MDRQDKPILLLKLGTATLTKGTEIISRAKLEDIAKQVIELRYTYDVLLVCSGAIAAAKQVMKLDHIGENISQKQALAAIGQPYLMKLITESFRDYELPVAQCLLSSYDFEHDQSRENIANTILQLLKFGILPIINENDTTATEEIRFGDNDKLSALVAELLKVELLVLASNTYGIYDDQEQTIPIVNDINNIRSFIKEEKSGQGTGGMTTKLEAASIAQQAKIPTYIVNGHIDHFLLKVLEDSIPYTKILP